MSISFFNPGDQAIYDSGLSFIPQERFRLGDPQLLSSPSTSSTSSTTSGINTLAAPTAMNVGNRDNQNDFNIDNRGLITTDFKNFEPNYSYTPPAYDEFTQKNMFDKFKDKILNII